VIGGSAASNKIGREAIRSPNSAGRDIRRVASVLASEEERD
jgi:hypothetical protein